MVAALALLACTLGSKVDFPWSYPQSTAELASAPIIAIVTADGDGAYSTRQEFVRAGTDTDDLILDRTVWCRTGRLTAIAGKGITAGEHLQFMTPESLHSGNAPLPKAPPTDRMPLRAGRRYLLMGFRQTKDRLFFPFLSDRGPFLKYGRTFDANAKNEVAAVMMFPTSQTSISSAPTLDDIRLAVVKTIDPADTDSYRRAGSFLRYDRPPRSKRATKYYGELEFATPSPATKTLVSILDKSDSYQQSHVWALLFHWRYHESTNGYVRALQKLADDPGIFRIEDGDYIPENSIRGLEFEPDKAPKLEQREFFDLVMNARNVEIAAFFMSNLQVTLTAAQIQALAQRLIDTNYSIRRGVAYCLALQNGDSDHQPDTMPADECIKYWIDYYKVR
jgi:hypothetical protein